MSQFMLKLSNLLDGSLKYLTAAILLTIPLFPKFPLFTPMGSQVSVRLEDFLIFIAALIWGVTVLPRLRSFLRDRLNRSMLLFWTVGLLSLISGVFITQTVVPHIGLLHWARRVEYLMVFFIGVSSVKSREDIAFYIKMLLIVVAVAFFYGGGQQYFNVPVIITQNPEYAKGVALRCPCVHLVSTFAGHYDLATYIVLVVPLFFVLMTSSKAVLKPFRVNDKLLKAVFLVSTTLGYWLLVMAASRVSIASYLGSVMLALLFTRSFLLIPLVIVFSLLFITTSTNLLERYMRAFQLAIEQLVSTIVEPVYAQSSSPSPTPEPPPAPFATDRSSSIRLNVEWPRALRSFRKNFLLGTGYSSITLATDNGYLRLLGEVGTLGFSTFILIFTNLFKEFFGVFFRKAKTLEIAYTQGIVAAIPGVLLNMVFIDILDASKFAITFWLLIGIAVAATRLERK